DGVVNSTDISLVNGGGRYNAGAPATWQQGDYNYSGDVNSTDVSLLNGAALYGTPSYLPVAGLGTLGGPLGGVSEMAGVPEPSAWGLAIMGLTVAAGVIRRGWWHF
ncbi:MAG: PEP-CTERM sorting domain-containing protein, partial [Planctomycetaceae bacterium]